METHENIPESTGTSEYKKQSANETHSSTKQQSRKALPFHVVTWLFKWFQVNTFAPGFLSGTWSQPIFGYFVACVGQLAIVIGLLALFHTYPSFRFLEGPLILFILLVALGWGAGPSVVALLIGIVLLIFFVFPPAFSLSFSQSSEVIELCLYVVIGLTISILASNTERARRTSEQLRLRLDTIIDAIPDSVVLYDLQGRRIQQNLVARKMGNTENPPLFVEEMPDQLVIRRAGGEPFPFEALPLVRALKGETVIGAELLYRDPVKQQDRLVSVSAAPLHAPSTKTIEGAVTITHDLTERKRIEDALRVSEERYRTIVQTANEGIWLIDTEARTLYANNRMAELLDVNTKDMLDHTVLEFVFPEDESDGYSHIRSNLLGNYEQFDFRFRRKDGRPLYTLACTSPIRNGEGTIIGALGMFTDMTEQKIAEEVRRQLAAIVLSSSDAIIGKTLAGIITSWNASAERMYGYTAEEIVGQPITRLFPPDRQDEFSVIMEQIKRGERLDHYETMRVRKDGTSLNVSVTVSPIIDGAGEIIGASAIARDISEQKLLQAELWKSRQQLEVILENIADGIIVQDVVGRIVYMNEVGAKLCGYASAAELLQASGYQTQVGYTLQRFEILDEQGAPFPLNELPASRALRGEEAPQAIVQYSDKESQQRRWSLVKAQPIFDENGEVHLAVSIFSDITESYEQQQRKDEFISMASHELKTPVTSLKGFTNVLQRRLIQQGDEQTLHYLSRMDFQLYKLTKIINDLLDISKIQAGQLSFHKVPFKLDSLIRETVEDVQAATFSHQLQIEGKTGLHILGDKDRLEQVFINLLTNAVKYSPRSDTVLVSLSRTQEEVIVCVKDFGIGIDESHHNKIFERFYQVTDPMEKTYPGLGMGLYISNEIVNRHHGRMWVESRKGEGATFYVALPIIQEDNLESPGINVEYR